MPGYYSIRDASEDSIMLGQNLVAGWWQHTGPGPQPRYYQQHDSFLAKPAPPLNTEHMHRFFSGANDMLQKKVTAAFIKTMPGENITPADAEFVVDDILNDSGSVATLAYISPAGHIITANAGDCRTSLFIIDKAGKSARGFALTLDHGTRNEQEVARVLAAGGQLVENGHYFAGAETRPALSCVRGFGHAALSSITSCKPDVIDYDLARAPFHLVKGERAVLVAATDGGHRNIPVSSQAEALGEALKAGLQTNQPVDLARHFATVAIKPVPSTDNVTIVAVEIDFARPDSAVIGAMDGNGEDGYLVSQAVRDAFAELIPAR